MLILLDEAHTCTSFLQRVKTSLCFSQTRLGRGFWRAVREVVKSNAAMDSLNSTKLDPVYHFDSERVDSAMLMLRQTWAQTLLSARAKEYQSARQSLGQLLHSLQVQSSMDKDNYYLYSLAILTNNFETAMRYS